MQACRQPAKSPDSKLKTREDPLILWLGFLFGQTWLYGAAVKLVSLNICSAKSFPCLQFFSQRSSKQGRCQTWPAYLLLPNLSDPAPAPATPPPPLLVQVFHNIGVQSPPKQPEITASIPFHTKCMLVPEPLPNGF